MSGHSINNHSGMGAFLRAAGRILCYAAILFIFLLIGDIPGAGGEEKVSRRQNLIRYAILAAVIAVALVISYLVLR